MVGIVLFGVLCHVTILVTWYKEGFSRAEKLSSMSMSLTQTSFLQIQNTAALLGGKLSRNRSKLSMGNSSFRGGEIRATNETKVKLPEDEWRKKLTPEQFRIARKKGTELAFTGQLLNEKREGTFQCVCCGTDLFSSKTKFDSGTGWPSFWNHSGNVGEKKDFSIPFMPRVEVVCNICDAHLGHVFNDGPRPTGLRYCINSASMKFEPAKQ